MCFTSAAEYMGIFLTVQGGEVKEAWGKSLSA
jgi:hypothetical protein